VPTRFIAAFGKGVRPGGIATFRFVNKDNTVVRSYSTVAAANGTIRPEDNVIPYDFTQVGQHIQVFAGFQPGTGGGPIPNASVGSITTTP